MNKKDFYILLLRLLKYVKIIPVDLIKDFCDESCELMKNIDINDSIFVALALAFDCPIWTNDKHFKFQKRVKVYTTKELISLGLS